MFLFACSRLLLTRDTLCTGFWTQNNPPLITKNNILIVNTFFQSFMLKVMNVYREVIGSTEPCNRENSEIFFPSTPVSLLKGAPA